jgi:hypothetical protein
MSWIPKDPAYRMEALQFHRVVEEMEIWSANSDGYSFTISFFESFSAPGFHGRPGYVASWRPLYGDRGAIKIVNRHRGQIAAGAGSNAIKTIGKKPIVTSGIPSFTRMRTFDLARRVD